MPSVWACLWSVAVVVPHASFSRDMAISLLHKWRPQHLNGHLLSLVGVKKYAFARVYLEQGGNQTSAILDEQLNLYLVEVNEAARTTSIAIVLWACMKDERIPRFRALREWHDHHLDAAYALHGDAIHDDDDRALWFASLQTDADDL